MPEQNAFRQRAKEVSRLEAFSDIVFGFALTLIVVALEVPETYEELIGDIGGFLGFAACFAILIWIWHVHYTFFRRYGLHDEYTIILNTILLFVVLFYVYPLKFVFASWTGHLHEPPTAAQAGTLFQIYGLGFTAIFAIYTLMYIHAWRKREELELNAVEQHDTRTHLTMYASYIGIGLLSTLIATVAPPRMVGWAGFTYALLGPVSMIIGMKMGKRRETIAAEAV